ncbi:ATP-binding protein [Stenotrophomonas sp. GD03958]|uniref:two-component system sensor histidine kinase NtrB n=1 Tax=Stenotrophomonas sp. GD03958 TaxID=2975411 RepID=UPI00244CA946|nr:ATP-binding protein [Stenotrophomonas sp. GD03958]MDH1193093.1 ATP-binding protein [Stenotrophomonas sp. GD03958]
MISQQRSTDALSDESRQFSLLVNSVTDYAIYMLDTAGFIRTWNTGGQRIKGYTAADVVGSHFSRFYLPEEAEAGFPQRNLRVAAEEGRYACEGWRLRQDGTPFRASVVIDPIWVDGDLVGFAKITRDITELHQAQEQLLEAQRELFQAQKMEAIGKFTLGLAHDFNNLLTIIANCLDMVSIHVDNPAAAALIDTAQRAGERGTLLTRQLLTFGKGQTLVPEKVRLRSLLHEFEGMLKRAAGDHVDVAIQWPEDDVEIELDRAQLEAAILNLVCNSRDAMPQGGQITVSAAVRSLQSPSSSTNGPLDYACITVCDDGEGIPKELQERVFEPFFTTKSIGKGSGLGLSQVFGFTSQSGGYTELISEVGKGTRVSLFFPIRVH